MTSFKLNGTGLFAQAAHGLTANFANLMVGNTNGGLTREDLKSIPEGVNKNSLSPSFISYIAQNFSKIDRDKSGTITQEDMQHYINTMMRSGMTRDQLIQLSMQWGGQNAMLEEILLNFDKIDKGRKGRITQEDIALFNLDKDINEIRDRHSHMFASSTASIWYSSSSDD